mmetsp:Transcript_14479/g.26773  ORF Transcript_14479/g.26773 Transcript_14479/m.26773 type:complete len:481 (-) Transcript_14479:1080-2522(-)
MQDDSLPDTLSLSLSLSCSLTCSWTAGLIEGISGMSDIPASLSLFMSISEWALYLSPISLSRVTASTCASRSIWISFSLLLLAFFCFKLSLFADSSSSLRLLKSSVWSLLPLARSAFTSFSIALICKVNFSFAPVSFLSYASISCLRLWTSDSARFAFCSLASLSISAPLRSIFISSTSFVASPPDLASSTCFFACSSAAICFFLSIWAASTFCLSAFTATTSFSFSVSNPSIFADCSARESSSLLFCRRSSATTFLSSSLWVTSLAWLASLVALSAKSLVFSACASFSVRSSTSFCRASLSFMTPFSSFVKSPTSPLLSESLLVRSRTFSSKALIWPSELAAALIAALSSMASLSRLSSLSILPVIPWISLCSFEFCDSASFALSFRVVTCASAFSLLAMLSSSLVSKSLSLLVSSLLLWLSPRSFSLSTAVSLTPCCRVDVSLSSFSFLSSIVWSFIFRSLLSFCVSERVISFVRTSS